MKSAKQVEKCTEDFEDQYYKYVRESKVTVAGTPGRTWSRWMKQRAPGDGPIFDGRIHVEPNESAAEIISRFRAIEEDSDEADE